MTKFTKEDFDFTKASKIQQVSLVKPIFLIASIILCTCAISVLGLYYSIQLNDWTIYSRSGAATIIFALILASIDHSVFGHNLFDMVIQTAKDSDKKTRFDRVREELIIDYKLYNISKSKEEIEYDAAKEMERRIESSKKETEYFSKKVLLKYELLISAYGTLIWGFGDLVGKLFT